MQQVLATAIVDGPTATDSLRKRGQPWIQPDKNGPDPHNHHKARSALVDRPSCLAHPATPSGMPASRAEGVRRQLARRAASAGLPRSPPPRDAGTSCAMACASVASTTLLSTMASLPVGANRR